MNMQYYDINVSKYGKDYRVTYLKRFVGDTLRVHEFDKELPMIGDRFASSVSRAKNAVLGLGKCNSWDYFATFTLDKRKYDRFDLNTWRTDFSRYIRNLRRSGLDIKYLLIPERHVDGAWHLHGLIAGIPWDSLLQFDPAVHPWKLIKGNYRYHEGITKKFGFNSFGKLRSADAAAAYVLKYCGKGFALQDMDSGTHLYYASHGLNRPEKVFDACYGRYLTDVSFENDFCAISWIKEDEYRDLVNLLGGDSCGF